MSYSKHWSPLFLRIPDEKRFILVLDNLDRVTKEKLREVWSDIEVFTSIAQTKIQLLIPYSITHVASSLSSDETEGMEFISKRIPISFRVAPILSADWKSSCSDMITETGITVKNRRVKRNSDAHSESLDLCF